MICVGRFLVASGGQHCSRLLPRMLRFLCSLPVLPWSKIPAPEQVNSFAGITHRLRLQSAEEFSFNLADQLTEVCAASPVFIMQPHVSRRSLSACPPRGATCCWLSARWCASARV